MRTPTTGNGHKIGNSGDNSRQRIATNTFKGLRMNDASNLPRVLIVDDDEITLRFFQGALSRLAGCVVAGDGATALSLAEHGAFDLFVIDLNLPDMHGEQLLRDLRSRHASTRAIATSAEVDARVRKKIAADGFDDIVEKPIAMDRLLVVIGNYLSSGASSTLLDDNAALQSLGGDRTSLHALRGLLAIELDDIPTKYKDSETIDREELSARLHRLRASCGFCGATALATVAANLQQSLHTDSTIDQNAIDRFVALCGTTATALRS
jgi:two-component system OmpR family response regulator